MACYVLLRNWGGGGGGREHDNILAQKFCWHCQCNRWHLQDQAFGTLCVLGSFMGLQAVSIA